MKGDLTQEIAEKFEKLRDIDSLSSLVSAHETLQTMIQEMYDQFEGLGYLYPNPFRS